MQSLGMRITGIRGFDLLIWVVALLLLCACSPSDRDLLTLFERHRESFDELVQLAYAESSSIQVGTTHQASYQIALNERLAVNPRASALLSDVGEPFVRILRSPDREKFQLWFQYDVRSRVPAFYASRGLAFVPDPIAFTSEATVGASTRKHRSAGAKVSYFYVPIEGNWFIYEEVVN